MSFTKSNDILYCQSHPEMKTMQNQSEIEAKESNDASSDNYSSTTNSHLLLQIKKMRKPAKRHLFDNSIIKEKLILKYLTMDNMPPNSDYIAKYIDFFESDTQCCLITECMDQYINLQQFTNRAHQYIKIGTLKIKHYQKIIKYVMWQLSVTIHWLHNDMHCCHLHLCMKNIRLQHSDFIEDSDGNILINPAITVKLSEFSHSEVFKLNDDRFYCMKRAILSDIRYVSPKRYAEQIYDARCDDMWALGMILYNMATGEPLYTLIDKKCGGGYWSIRTNNLRVFLFTNNLIKYVNGSMLSMINNLLQITETERINIVNILNHSWFRSYYNRYRQLIEQKSVTQRQQLLQQQKKNGSLLPYYYYYVYIH